MPKELVRRADGGGTLGGDDADAVEREATAEQAALSQAEFILFFVGAGAMTSLDFAASARRLADAARQSGRTAPGFRSPPRNPGCRRSIRRRRSGDAVVAVQVRERPPLAVLADMIDGVIVANRLSGSEAGELRDQLWQSVADLFADATPSARSVQAEVRPIRAA